MKTAGGGSHRLRWGEACLPRGGDVASVARMGGTQSPATPGDLLAPFGGVDNSRDKFESSRVDFAHELRGEKSFLADFEAFFRVDRCGFAACRIPHNATVEG